jgi:hypothetical protein
MIQHWKSVGAGPQDNSIKSSKLYWSTFRIWQWVGRHMTTQLAQNAPATVPPRGHVGATFSTYRFTESAGLHVAPEWQRCGGARHITICSQHRPPPQPIRQLYIYWTPQQYQHKNDVYHVTKMIANHDDQTPRCIHICYVYMSMESSSSMPIMPSPPNPQDDNLK